jgi:hypothetical protein
VLSSNTATIKPTVTGDENIVFKNALNCKDEKMTAMIKQKYSVEVLSRKK